MTTPNAKHIVHMKAFRLSDAQIFYHFTGGKSIMHRGTSVRRRVPLSWHPYRPLTWANVQTYAPASAGVYKLAVLTTERRLSVFYVGQALDLDARLKDHLSDAEPNPCLRETVRRYDCRFSVASVASQQDRDAAERNLYFHFRPSCNEIVPSGPDCLVYPLNTN